MFGRFALCLISVAVSTTATYWLAIGRDHAAAARTAYWFDHCASLFELTGDCYTHIDHHDVIAKMRLHHLRDEARAARNAIFPALRYQPVEDGARRQAQQTPTCDDAYIALKEMGPHCAMEAWKAVYKPQRYALEEPFDTLLPIGWTPPPKPPAEPLLTISMPGTHD